MFDILEIYIQLPDRTSPPVERFHTNSFDNKLELYVISPSGEVYKEVVRREPYSLLENEYIREYLTNLNTTINFYSTDSRIVDRNYYATIEAGRVTKIWYID